MNIYKIDCVLDPRIALKFKGKKSQAFADWLFERIADCEDFRYIVKLETGFNSLSVAVCSLEDVSPDKIRDTLNKLSSQEDVGNIDFEFQGISPAELLKNPALTAGDKVMIKGLAEGKCKHVASAEEQDRENQLFEELMKQQEESKDNVFADIENLIGADELKSWARSMKAVADKNADAETVRRCVMCMSYLVSVNSGNGSETVFESIGRVIAKLVGKNNVSLKEYTVNPDKDSKEEYNIPNILKATEYAEKDGDTLHVFALHIDCFEGGKYIAEWFRLLSGLRNARDRVVVIFVLPYLEKLALSDIHDRIEDIIPNRVISIRPMTIEDYILCFKRYFEKYGLEIDEDVYPVIPRVIAKEKSDGRFYGIDTINKICDEISYCKLLGSAADSSADNGKITVNDIKMLLDDEDNEDKVSGMEKLESMVSLDEVKKTINEIIATINMQRNMNTSYKPSMHMMFSGAPGTGKTVVARLLGQILRENKLLSTGGFYEVSRKDLVGAYVGHTAPKTAEICKLAYGGVLFIDEAYLLDGGSENDFGKEAIGTLIAEMENKRDNMVVIFAGYEKELERLFDLNPGLRDRIPYRIHFPNYDRDELRQIFYKNIPSDFSYDEGFEGAVGDYFENLSDDIMLSSDFSNGRFVRNLVERVCSKVALRLHMEDSQDAALVMTAGDFAASVADGEFKSLNKPKKRQRAIGF